MNELIFISSTILASLFTMISRKMTLVGLVAWVTAQSILSNIFVLKQIQLFGLNVTASDVFTISCMFSVLLIQELYGKKDARKAINASFMALAFFSIGSQFHLAYTPSSFDTTQEAYAVLFGPNLRIVLASIISYWVSQQCNLWLFEKLSKRFLQCRLSIRGFFSVLLAQSVDTTIFALLGLYGLVSEIEQIILFSFIIKIIGTILLSQIVLLKNKVK